MYEFFIQPFVEFEFMRRALLGCLAIALSASPVGVFLMLRRMSLTGDAMAHAILPGAAVGFLFAGLSVTTMTVGGLIAGCLVAILAGATSRKTNTAEDSNMAAFYLISLALGVMIISMKGNNVDLLHVLFGSTLALNNAALVLLTLVCSITLLTLAVLFRPLVVECLDTEFLKSVSRLSAVAHFALLILIVLNLVGGFHALGTLMSVGLMILPATIARFWVSELETMILLAVVLSFIGCYSGLLLSYHFSLPTSPLIIVCLGAGYFCSILFGTRRGIVFRFIQIQRRHLTA